MLYNQMIRRILQHKTCTSSIRTNKMNVNQISSVHGQFGPKINGSTDIKPQTTLVLKCSDTRSVGLATKHLLLDNVIAIPTDTVYGFACSANSAAAIQRLYAIKGREQTKAVAICVANIDDLRHWGEADHLPDELLSRLLPGAVTIILHRSKHLDNPYLNQGFSKVGIRIPNFDFIRDVTDHFGYPIALTSANRSSESSTLRVSEFETIWPDLGMVFDGGALGLTNEQRAGSTIVDLSEKGYYTIIRNGVVAQQTFNILEEFKVRLKNTD